MKTQKSRMFPATQETNLLKYHYASQPSSPILSSCHILGLLLEDVERILAADGFSIVGIVGKPWCFFVSQGSG